MRSRRGVSLVEVLVGLAVLGVLLALLLPAIMKVRSAAGRTQCQNKQHQIGLALHGYAAKHQSRLASLDGNPKPIYEPSLKIWGSRLDPLLFVAILPDLGLPRSAVEKWEFVAEYICPDDPSLPPERRPPAFMVPTQPTSYPGNAFALAGNPSLTANFPDGLSNTIGVAERYVNCGKMTQNYSEFEAVAFNVRRPTFADGGPLFGGKNFDDVYPVTENRVTRPSRPGATFVVGGKVWHYHPNGGLDWKTAGNDRPDPVPRPGECDPAVPNSPHPGGLNVLLMDGSVRMVRASITPAVFWGAVTPAGGEVLGDW